MTAITPLEFVHKKGIFGDHHKKDESNLTKISEVKNLNIFQIVKYKKSKIDINNIEIDNLKLPQENLKVNSSLNTRILWNAPRTWLIISTKENIFNIIKKNLNNENFSITDISHSRAVIQVKGFQSREILKKGSPINFNDFQKNYSVGTVFHGINIIIDLVDDNPDTFNLLTLRSFGETFYHHITDAALEFGYVGV